MDFLPITIVPTVGLVALLAAWVVFYFMKSTPRARQWQWWTLLLGVVLAMPLTWWVDHVYAMPAGLLADWAWLELWLILSLAVGLLPVLWLRLAGPASLIKPLSISAAASSALIGICLTATLVGFATDWLASLVVVSSLAMFGWWGSFKSAARVKASLVLAGSVAALVLVLSLLWGLLWPEAAGYQLFSLASLVDVPTLALSALLSLGIGGICWQLFDQPATS